MGIYKSPIGGHVIGECVTPFSLVTSRSRLHRA
jgi:hypothetical protein